MVWICVFFAIKGVSMKILPVDLERPAVVRRFLRLPFEIYANTPQWVPPLESDAKQMLDRRRHPFYRHSQAAFFLAEENGQDLGRLAVLDNRPYNEYNHCQTAFFTLFECQPREDAAAALFASGCAWARARGLGEMVGPKGMSVLDGMGLLVRGFEYRPALGIPYNLPYYAALVEAAGFTLQGETVSGRIDRSLVLPEKVRAAARAVEERRGLRVQRFRTRADLRSFLPRLKGLYNGALEGTTGTYPLSDAEARTMAEQILWFADPKLIQVIFKGDDLAGFLFAYPDISAAVQRTKGQLWPLGWADLLREFRRTKWLNINGAAILPKYRGLGATALLFREIYDSFMRGGFEAADLVQIGVENERMQNELRALNVDFYKTHRTYRRQLDGC
jgi:hypothetical protein